MVNGLTLDLVTGDVELDRVCAAPPTPPRIKTVYGTCSPANSDTAEAAAASDGTSPPSPRHQRPQW